MGYELATNDEAAEIWGEVDEWIRTAPMSWIFGNCMSTARRAIGEYLANQRGLSLWRENLHRESK